MNIVLKNCPECGKPYVLDLSRHNLRNWLNWVLSGWLFVMIAVISVAISFSLIVMTLVLGALGGLSALGGAIQLYLRLSS